MASPPPPVPSRCCRSGARHLPPIAVAIVPPRPEVGLKPLIRALIAQTSAANGRLVVFAAVGDRVAATAAAFQAAKASSLELHLFEAERDRHPASEARRLVEAARFHLRRRARGADPVLLLIHPEALPARDWIERNLVALESGADLVCGCPVPSAPQEPGPLAPAVQALLRYRRLAAQLEEVLDPVSWDPGPRHTDESGISVACRLSSLEAAGSLPEVPGLFLEHLIARVRQSGRIVRHCPDTRVAVPGHLLASEHAEEILPDCELSMRVPDPIDIENRSRRRADLRARLERRYRRLAPRDRGLAVRAHVALAEASAHLSPLTMSANQACRVLRARLDTLEAGGEARSAPSDFGPSDALAARYEGL